MSAPDPADLRDSVADYRNPRARRRNNVASQPSTTDEAVSAGLPLPDRWDVAGPHPPEPTWQTMLGPITVLHDDHTGVLIAGQWEDVTPEQVDELAEKLHAVARWLRMPEATT